MQILNIIVLATLLGSQSVFEGKRCTQDQPDNMTVDGNVRATNEDSSKIIRLKFGTKLVAFDDPRAFLRGLSELRFIGEPLVKEGSVKMDREGINLVVLPKVSLGDVRDALVDTVHLKLLHCPSIGIKWSGDFGRQDPTDKKSVSIYEKRKRGSD